MRLKSFLLFVLLFVCFGKGTAQNAPCTFRTAAATLRVTLEDAHIHGLTDDYVATARLFDISNARKPKLLIASTVGGGWHNDFESCNVLKQLGKQVLVFMTFYSADGGKSFVNVYDLKKKIEQQYPGKKDLKICYPELLNDTLLLLRFSTYKDPMGEEYFIAVNGRKFEYMESRDKSLINLFRITAAQRIHNGSLEPERYESNEAAWGKNQKVLRCYGEQQPTTGEKAKEARLLGAWIIPVTGGDKVEAAPTALPGTERWEKTTKDKVGVKGNTTMLFRADHIMQRHYQVGDSMYNTLWHWRVSGDTLIYTFKNDLDDTVAIYDGIVSLDSNVLISKRTRRENITEPALCGGAPNITCAIGAEPVYSGDAKAYFTKVLKGFMPKKDSYRASFRFTVNCRGEVTHIKDNAYNDFDKLVGKALRNMKGWRAPQCNGKPFDSQAAINVEWNKGFIDVSIYQPRY